jgi:Fur family ferric uptake transcriptional regulator
MLSQEKLLNLWMRKLKNFKKKVAEKYGYKLVDHKLELYGIKKKS